MCDEDTMNEKIDELKEENNDMDLENIMSCKISRKEVMLTFGTCVGAAGPDGFHANLLDTLDRERVLLSAFCFCGMRHGVFIDKWKEEERSVLAKPHKLDYHITSSYRTVSLTSIIGKRYEKITSRRVIAILENQGFDVDQYAYLEGRSGT